MPETPVIDPLSPADWHDSLSRIQADMRGKPLNVHQLLANHPQLLNAWWPLRMHSNSGSSLGERERELVILRTAVHLRCWYEWASHVVRGQAAGLSLEEIGRVLEDPSADDWSAADSDLLQAVDALATENRLPEALVARLGTHLDGRQLLDLIATYSMYTMLGFILNTWSIDVDDDVLAALPESITRSRFSASVSGG